MQLRILILLTLFLSIQLSAQTSGVNYKAIIKDTNGNSLAGTFMNIQFTIHQSTTTGTIVYQEDHNYTTDSNGLVILNIGSEPSPNVGVFADIDWAVDKHFLQVTIAYVGGTINFDATEFMAVPYALQSDNANTLTLTSGATNQFSIGYDTPGDKLIITEEGVTGNVLEIKDGELYLPQYAGSDNRMLLVDAAGKVISLVNPQTISYNRFEFTEKDVSATFTKITKGVQFPDGTELSGIKTFLLDNVTGNNGVANTVFSGIYRTSKTSLTTTQPIYRIDGSDTPTDEFDEFTATNLFTPGSNIIDNANYIYFLEVFYCNTCLIREVTVLHD